MLLSITCIEITLTCNTTESPEVLVLTITAIRPSEHLESKLVFTLLKIPRHVKLWPYLRVFTIANELTIHPQIYTRRH